MRKHINLKVFEKSRNRSKKIGNFSKFELREISKKFEEFVETPKKRVLRGSSRIFDPFPC